MVKRFLVAPLGLSFALVFGGCPSATGDDAGSVGELDAGDPLATDAGPVFDEENGVLPISVEEGALAGTWGQAVHAGGTVNIPLQGPTDAEHDDYNLVVRVWDEASATYAQTVTHCASSYGAVFDMTTVFSGETIASLAPSEAALVEVNHEAGRMRVTGELQLWGLRDLPQPTSTPLPANITEAGEAPHTGRIFDMDDDGEPGITTQVVGAVQGEVYAIQRKVTGLDGATLSVDRVVGRSESRIEILTLGSSVPILVVPDLQVDETERDRSWFEEVRLDEGADCADVIELMEAGGIGQGPEGW